MQVPRDFPFHKSSFIFLVGSVLYGCLRKKLVLQNGLHVQNVAYFPPIFSQLFLFQYFLIWYLKGIPWPYFTEISKFRVDCSIVIKANIYIWPSGLLDSMKNASARKCVHCVAAAAPIDLYLNVRVLPALFDFISVRCQDWNQTRYVEMLRLSLIITTLCLLTSRWNRIKSALVISESFFI